LTDRAIRRGVFRSVADLEAAITAYIDATNANPKPFRWIKSADDILASIQRFLPTHSLGAGPSAMQQSFGLHTDQAVAGIQLAALMTTVRGRNYKE
jgi:hypothetical protein